MAQKYYNTLETAHLLGISEDEVKQMLDRRELHGYRDGANWKFKAEDIENLAQQRKAEAQAAPEEEESDDVLLSEVALGQSDLAASGTVIGMNGVGMNTGDSDIQLAGSSILLSDTSQTPPAISTEDVGASASKFEDLELSLDDDLTIGGSTGTLPGRNAPPTGDSGGSAIDLSGRDLEDDDLVLGGSGKGSDISIGGDSGISLVDPADSGLSLEQPLDLAGSDESLELGEDDLLTIGEGGSSPKPGQTDDDFLLTPLEEASDLDESESGSQVIALDTEEVASAGMIDASSGGSMAAMLDEDISAHSGLDMGLGAPLAGSPGLGPHMGGLGEGAPLMHPTTSVMLGEPPYSGWQIAGLATCAVLLMFCGMMMYDNLRNMWSWGGPYTVNSTLMDLIVGLFEGK